MSDIVKTFRSYALDKDNFPRMATEVVPTRVSMLLEAADKIERLEAALGSLVSYTKCHYVDGYCVQHSSPNPCEMAEARAALENTNEKV